MTVAKEVGMGNPTWGNDRHPDKFWADYDDRSGFGQDDFDTKICFDNRRI